MNVRSLPRLLAPALGLSCWVQLAALPLASSRGSAWSVGAAAIALGALGLSNLPSVAPGRALLASVVVFPAALALFAIGGAGLVARYDAPGQVVVAATMMAFMASAAHRWSADRARVGTILVASDVRESSGSTAPRMRGVAWVALVGVALFLSIVAPIAIGGASTRGHAGGALLRGRLSLVVAGALLLTCGWVLLGGGALLRKGPITQRSATRAWFYLCAAAVAFAMRWWLDHAR